MKFSALLKNKNNNTAFFQWLSGYLEGEGNFQVFPKKVVNTKNVITHYGVGVGFHLGLHIREIDLLVNLQNRFNNIGKIYHYPLKQEAHYAITKIADLSWFIENVLDKCTFYSRHQSIRFQLLRHCVENKIKRVETYESYEKLLALGNTFVTTLPVQPINPLLFNNYIIGFINAEASFTMIPTGKGKFAIEHTDSNIINLIHDYIKFSTNVYSPTKRTGRKQTFAISVTRNTDLAKIMNLINTSYPLQGYKQVQYHNWVENYVGVDWDYKKYLD